MRHLIESLFPAAHIVSWDEPGGAGDGPIFSALLAGRLFVADSPTLLLSALQEASVGRVCLPLAA